MKKVNLLSRAEMRRVIGGDAPGSCTATCGDRKDAVCSGSGCQATDGVGCVGSESEGDPTHKACIDMPLK